MNKTGILAAAITYSLFPIHFLGGLVFAFYAVKKGWSLPVCLAGISATTALVVATLERIHPRHVSWNHSKDDVHTDLAHTVVSMIALPPLLESAILIAVLTLLGGASAETFAGVWPHHWSLWGQLGLALLVSQVFEY